MKNTKLSFTIGLLVFSLVILGFSGYIMAEFPDDTITILVNYGPGSSSDVMTRALADELEQILDVPVNVKNRSGGSGTVGVAEVMRAEPDGYTIGNVTFTPMAISPHLMDVPYDTDDFKYFCAFGEWLYGLFCHGGLDWHSVEDVVEFAKENPGELKHAYSSHANARPMMALMEQENLDVQLIPTDGGAESEQMVAGGHVHTIARHPGILDRFNESEIRFLHPAGNNRWEQWDAGDKPTLQEKGYDIEVRSWIGLAAPKGIPEDRFEILNKAIKEAVQTEHVKNVVFNTGLLPMYMPGEEYKKFIEEGKADLGEMMEKYDL